MKKLALVLIRAYRLTLGLVLGNNCRFYPSCSHYTETAIERFGIVKGTWLGIKRISKCHPWHEGGIDQVPAQDNNT